MKRDDICEVIRSVEMPKGKTMAMKGEDIVYAGDLDGLYAVFPRLDFTAMVLNPADAAGLEASANRRRRGQKKH